jgi:hypothetical protein
MLSVTNIISIYYSHQIGLRAIALDQVSSEDYEQQQFYGSSYHDSLLPT